MNLNQLWAGSDYVLYESRGRGETFRSNGVRIRIIRAYQENRYGGERATGMAEVWVLDREGNAKKSNLYPDGIKRNVRARDIAMRWEEYEDMLLNYEERVAAAEKVRREKEDHDAKMRVAITDFLESKGIPRLWVTSVSDSTVYLSRLDIENALQGE